MAFCARADSARHGVSRSNPSSSPSASSSRREYSRVCPPDHGATAPSRSVRSTSGTIRSGSTSLRVPMPVHSGQAPNGELNEKLRGSIASKLRSQYGQARCSEKVRSLGASGENLRRYRSSRRAIFPQADPPCVGRLALHRCGERTVLRRAREDGMFPPRR